MQRIQSIGLGWQNRHITAAPTGAQGMKSLRPGVPIITTYVRLLHTAWPIRQVHLAGICIQHPAILLTVLLVLCPGITLPARTQQQGRQEHNSI